MLTLAELKERLASHLDPDDLLELLNITSEQLVERFEDLIEARYPRLLKELGEEDYIDSNSSD